MQRFGDRDVVENFTILDRSIELRQILAADQLGPVLAFEEDLRKERVLFLILSQMKILIRKAEQKSRRIRLQRKKLHEAHIRQKRAEEIVDHTPALVDIDRIPGELTCQLCILFPPFDAKEGHRAFLSDDELGDIASLFGDLTHPCRQPIQLLLERYMPVFKFTVQRFSQRMLHKDICPFSIDLFHSTYEKHDRASHIRLVRFWRRKRDPSHISAGGKRCLEIKKLAIHLCQHRRLLPPCTADHIP